MADALPEGTERDDVIRAALGYTRMVEAVNTMSTYLLADDGTLAETMAEDAMEACVQRIIAEGPSMAEAVLIAFATTLVVTGDQEKIQAHIVDQARRTNEALGLTDD